MSPPKPSIASGHPGPAASPLPTNALLRQLGRRFAAEYQQRLADAGNGDLTVTQTQMLSLVGATGGRITDIAAAAGITKQAVALVVNQLETLGYARRVPDPDDARAKVVELTTRGHDALGESRRVLNTINRRWARALGPELHQQFRDALLILLEATDS